MRKSTLTASLPRDAYLQCVALLEASAAGPEGGKSKSPAEHRHKAQQQGVTTCILYADVFSIISALCACSIQPFSGHRCGVTLKSNNRRTLVQVAAASEVVQLAWLRN